ncbi:MAG: phosphomannomutase/phosphoglucomutase [Gammaproteobacteria bacterium]|nr:phosphomannomutase/phosphoglucomutase [Gammaproteobacteria bacterium]
MKRTPELKLGGKRIRLAVVAAVALLAVAGVLFLGSGGNGEGPAPTAADTLAKTLAGRLQRGLDEELAPIREAVKTAPGVAAATADVAPVATSHPAILAVRRLPAGHRQVDYDASPPLTYAAIDMLKKAEASSRIPNPEALLTDTKDAHIAWLLPATTVEGEIGWYVFVALDVGLIQRVVEGLADPGVPVVVEQVVPGSANIALAGRGGALRGGVTSHFVPGYGWKLSVGTVSLGDEVSDAVGDLPVAWIAGAVVVLGLVVMVLVRRRRAGGDDAAGDGDRSPVVLDGAVKSVGVMSHETMQFVVEDYISRGAGEGMGTDTGITVTEGPVAGEAAEPQKVAASEPEMDFMEIFESSEEPSPAVETPEAADDGPPRALFRAYDIRGAVAAGLDAELARDVGQAVGSAAAARGEKGFVVGRDGRQSSRELAEAMVAGLMEAGMDVIDVGLVPTPVVYFAARYLDVGSCVVVTGSHNPATDNGFKVVIGGETLPPEGIMDLRRRVVEKDFVTGDGSVQQMDVGADYIRRISEDIPVALGNAFKLVVDCANGATSELAPRLYRALGHDVVDLYCKVDGRFPNHPPDPCEPENLKALQAAVKQHDADLGLALDGDGDRLVVVDGTGHIVWPDRLLMAFAADVLERNPGADVVFDVKCSRHLPRVITEAGGNPVMWKSGHSLMKAKMVETGAPLGGEMSGHIFFKERWYGFDDGLYAGARLLEILQQRSESPTAFFATLPQTVATPELRAAVPEGVQHTLMERLTEVTLEGAEIDRTDGVRAEYPDGWGLLRASNTTPSLVFRFEADDAAALARIQGAFRDLMSRLRPDLHLPF